MIYGQFLYLLGFLPKLVQLPILIAMGVLSLKMMKDDENREIFKPISSILMIQVARNLFFFVVAEEVSNWPGFFATILLILVLVLVAHKQGPFGIVMVIGSILLALRILIPITSLPISFIIYLTVFIYYAVLNIINIIKQHELLYPGMLKLMVFLVIGIAASWIVGGPWALELFLFGESLLRAIKNGKPISWFLLLIAGLFFYYLIELAFAHILWLIILIALAIFIFNKVL